MVARAGVVVLDGNVFIIRGKIPLPVKPPREFLEEIDQAARTRA